MQSLVQALQKVSESGFKIRIQNYSTNYGDFSNFSLWIENYQVVVRKALEVVSKIIPTIDLVRGKDFSLHQLQEAKNQLIYSFHQSLGEKRHSGYTCHKVYSFFQDRSNQPISGIKLHQVDHVLHLEGICLNRQVTLPATLLAYPLESSTLVRAKNWLRSRTPLSRWIQLKISVANSLAIQVEQLSAVESGVLQEMGLSR